MKNSFLESFQQFKIIHCLCPKCNTISRLSEFHIYSDKPSPMTWLDTHEKKIQKIESDEAKFGEIEQTMRESAHERAQKQVPRLIREAMNNQFSKKKIDPYDIKPILHPIEFVLFDGSHQNNLTNVTFLAQKSGSTHMTLLQKQISDVIKGKHYDWSVARVSNNGDVKFES